MYPGNRFGGIPSTEMRAKPRSKPQLRAILDWSTELTRVWDRLQYHVNPGAVKDDVSRLRRPHLISAIRVALKVHLSDRPKQWITIPELKPIFGLSENTVIRLMGIIERLGFLEDHRKSERHGHRFAATPQLVTAYEHDIAVRAARLVGADERLGKPPYQSAIQNRLLDVWTDNDAAWWESLQLPVTSLSVSQILLRRALSPGADTSSIVDIHTLMGFPVSRGTLRTICERLAEKGFIEDIRLADGKRSPHEYRVRQTLVHRFKDEVADKLSELRRRDFGRQESGN